MSAFFMGVVVGFVILLGVAHLPSSVVVKYNDAKEICELELPRNQTCEILFVPKPLEIKE